MTEPRFAWDDTSERRMEVAEATRRVTHRKKGKMPNITKPVHVPTLLEQLHIKA